MSETNNSYNNTTTTTTTDDVDLIVQYIAIRNDLKWPKGALVAQVHTFFARFLKSYIYYSISLKLGVPR